MRHKLLAVIVVCLDSVVSTQQLFCFGKYSHFKNDENDENVVLN